MISACATLIAVTFVANKFTFVRALATTTTNATFVSVFCHLIISVVVSGLCAKLLFEYHRCRLHFSQTIKHFVVSSPSHSRQHVLRSCRDDFLARRPPAAGGVRPGGGAQGVHSGKTDVCRCSPMLPHNDDIGHNLTHTSKPQRTDATNLCLSCQGARRTGGLKLLCLGPKKDNLSPLDLQGKEFIERDNHSGISDNSAVKIAKS